MKSKTVTLSQDNLGTSVGDFLSQVRKSQTYQNIQISCSNGRLLENQLIVGLVYYELVKNFSSEIFPDLVLILPDYTMEEVSDIFTEVYNQSYKGVFKNDKADKSKLEDTEDIIVKLEPITTELMATIQDDFDEQKQEAHGEISEHEYSCNLCNYKSNKSKLLERHIERMHNNGKKTARFSCEICSFTCKAHANLLRHNETGCEQRSESCWFCDKKLKSKMTCIRHMRNYHKEEFKQYREGKRATKDGKKKDLKTPKLVPISEKSLQKIEHKKAQDRVKVPCEICAQLLAKDHLKKHLYNIHKIGSVQKSKHIYPKIPCPECQQLVSSMSISRHLRVAHRMKGVLGNIDVDCIHCLNKIPIASFQHHVRNTCFARNTASIMTTVAGDSFC